MNIEWIDDENTEPEPIQTRICPGQELYPHPQIQYYDARHEIWSSYNKLSFLHLEANIRHIYRPSEALNRIILRLKNNESCWLELHKLPKKPKKRKNAIFAFFSCSPHGEKLDFLLNLADSTISHPMVDRYWYAIEWRKHEPPSGVHVHIIMTFKEEKIDSNSLRTFKQFFKRKCKKNIFDTKTFDISMLKDKIAYISGETYDKDKNDKKEKDKKIRRKKNLKDIYSNATRKVSPCASLERT